mmetsp:Transcript_31879/g.71547  ORF Transcript_31879/g.71547 Transcript_31879/m.71547 type:complete len:386 (+) Transcript_31879:93-1250(+)
MCKPLERPSGRKKKAAATAEHGFSPTLVRASADYEAPSVLAWAFVTLCTASFYLGPLILASPLLVYFIHPSAAGAAFATAVFLACHPVRPNRRFCGWCQLFYRVFDFHHNFTPRVNDVARRGNRLSIVAMHPHSIIPLHGFIWSAICDQLLPDMYGFGCTTDQALNLPVLRHLLQYMDVRSTSKRVIMSGMQSDNKNLFILPGGVAEIFLSHRRARAGPNVQTIKARRYGLVKLALQTGAVIYPSFVFGASDMLDQLTPAEDDAPGGREGGGEVEPSLRSRMGRAMERLSRRIKGGLTLYYGQFGLPIPHNPRLTMVMGDPIYPIEDDEGSTRNVGGNRVTCRRIEDPTDEQIEDLMGRYLDAMEGLFEQYKVQAGYEQEELRII